MAQATAQSNAFDVAGRLAAFPERKVITGRHVSIVPMTRDHLSDLHVAVTGQDNDGLWTYTSYGPFSDLRAFEEGMVDLIETPNQLLYTFILNGKPAGWAAFSHIDLHSRSMEVGHILFGPALRRSRAATEAMYLMSREAFDCVGCRRYEWKCNALNIPSAKAALRLGFNYEGTFRQHMIIKGRSRDSNWYSMLDTEWPTAKKAFEKWLEDSNFDRDGQQILSLVDIRKSIMIGI